jgi:hypothetical protein
LSPFHVSRTRRGPDPYLPFKQLIFAIGAFLAMIGIAIDRPWLVNIAIGVLLLGIVLRFAGIRRGRAKDPDPEEDEERGS